MAMLGMPSTRFVFIVYFTSLLIAAVHGVGVQSVCTGSHLGRSSRSLAYLNPLVAGRAQSVLASTCPAIASKLNCGGRRCRSVSGVLPLKGSMSWGEEEHRDRDRDQDDESSSKVICRTLEVSFRRVWLRLFTTGSDENYVAELKEFVQGGVAAYNSGYSLPALILELGRHELETGDPNVDKTVRLTDQERQTREVWLVLIYLTLHRVGHKPPTGIAPPRPSDNLGLGALVESTCGAYSAGFSLEGLRLELTVRSGDTPLALTPAQVSLRSQWTRIVFLTCQIVRGSPKP